MTTLFMLLIIVISVLLMLVVLVQNPKGGGLSSAFGGDSGNMLGGVRRTNDFLEKSTWTLALALLVLVLLVNITNPSSQIQTTPESQIDEEIDNAAPTFQSPMAQPTQPSDLGLPESAEEN
jgi:preprotein translocase subunit SecG|tara:strand:- start:45 stop:407 length:363 start_codon:yes stop_codon:yes gene_type:complete